ncbi:hypothetical protein ACFL60_02495 [Candidatus Omnitrophota bacterium]
MTKMTPEQKLLNLIKSAQADLKIKKELKIFTKVSIVLVLLIMVILAVFLKDFFTFNYNVSKHQVDPVVVVEAPLMTDFKEEVNKDPGPKPIDVKELAKCFNVLGIIEGENDQAIIEDKETDKTFFLYKGDRFKEFNVFDIKKGRVILDYKGEKVVLSI